MLRLGSYSCAEWWQYRLTIQNCWTKKIDLFLDTYVLIKIACFFPKKQTLGYQGYQSFPEEEGDRKAVRRLWKQLSSEGEMRPIGGSGCNKVTPVWYGGKERTVVTNLAVIPWMGTLTEPMSWAVSSMNLICTLTLTTLIINQSATLVPPTLRPFLLTMWRGCKVESA